MRVPATSLFQATPDWPDPTSSRQDEAALSPAWQRCWQDILNEHGNTLRPSDS
jgi:hypothetical protein